MAHEAVRRIDLIFGAEREINGLVADKRLELRRAHVAPLVAELEAWMRAERARLSRHNDVTKAMDYMLTRWTAFTRFLEDGRICLTNNAAERALRCVAVGRRNWTFCGSDRGGEQAAAIYSYQRPEIVTHRGDLREEDAYSLAVIASRRRSNPVVSREIGAGGASSGLLRCARNDGAGGRVSEFRAVGITRRDGKIERHRSRSMACRCAPPDQRPSRVPARRTAAVELEGVRRQIGGMRAINVSALGLFCRTPIRYRDGAKR